MNKTKNIYFRKKRDRHVNIGKCISKCIGRKQYRLKIRACRKMQEIN